MLVCLSLAFRMVGCHNVVKLDIKAQAIEFLKYVLSKMDKSK